MSTKLKPIFTLNVGEYFGEIALMQKEAQRTCTVKIGQDDTNLMEINKEAFDKFVGEYKTESVITIINFYRQCSLFDLIPDQRKVELSAKSFLIKYPSNTVIARQGDVPYNIYFIASGSARAARRIKSKDKKSDPLNEGQVYQTNKLKAGDSFCDYELFSKRNIMDTVITTTPTVIIYVPYFWVVERLSPADLTKLKSNTKQKLENEAILKIFNQNQYWDDYKKNLLQHMLFEKQTEWIKQGKIAQYTTDKVDLTCKTKNMLSMVHVPSITTRLARSVSSSNFLPPLKKHSNKKTFKN